LPRKSSEVWKYMTKASNKTVKCELCFKKLALSKNQSSGNLIRHLRKKHPEEFPTVEEEEKRESHYPKRKASSFLIESYFLKESDTNSKCTLCDSLVDDTELECKLNHLVENHSEEKKKEVEKILSDVKMLLESFTFTGREMGQCKLCSRTIEYKGSFDRFRFHAQQCDSTSDDESADALKTELTSESEEDAISTDISKPSK